VSPNRPAKSSSSECTYAEDITDLNRIRDEILEMAREVADWLVRRDLLARTVTIKVRYDDFTTITRSHSAAATRDADDIIRRALALLGKTEAGQRPVRLLGAGVHNLVGLVDLDDEAERWPLFQNAAKLSE
jgi:DNA polymerase-4